MTTPTIHLNGTPRERLIDALCDAGGAVSAAIGAVRYTAPNGRDYYPQGPEAIGTATAEHLVRLAKLQTVLDELQALALAIDEA